MIPLNSACIRGFPSKTPGPMGAEICPADPKEVPLYWGSTHAIGHHRSQTLVRPKSDVETTLLMAKTASISIGGIYIGFAQQVGFW